jgi:hypothetical protein
MVTFRAVCNGAALQQIPWLARIAIWFDLRVIPRIGTAWPTSMVDLFLGPGRREILREGAIATHEIVVVLQQ